MSVWNNPYISKRGKYADCDSPGITPYWTSGTFSKDMSGLQPGSRILERAPKRPTIGSRKKAPPIAPVKHLYHNP